MYWTCGRPLSCIILMICSIFRLFKHFWWSNLLYCENKNSKKRKMGIIRMINIKHYKKCLEDTGIPKTGETLKTTVRNISSLFFWHSSQCTLISSVDWNNWWNITNDFTLLFINCTHEKSLIGIKWILKFISIILHFQLNIPCLTGLSLETSFLQSHPLWIKPHLKDSPQDS